jgi:DNA-nicking Smr family endonuclease
MKKQSLADLAKLRAELAAEREQAESTAAAAAARAAGIEAERRRFADAVGPVTRLRREARTEHRLPLPDPEPRQRIADERAALREAWSDAVDVESLLLTDDGLGFRRPGLGAEVLARLRRGHWAIQGELDLHGLRRDEARAALGSFLVDAGRRGWRCLRVVHGKGLGSPGHEPVLKAKVQRWLAQHADVLAFAQASGPQGGAGALIVLLAGSGR